MLACVIAVSTGWWSAGGVIAPIRRSRQTSSNPISRLDVCDLPALAAVLGLGAFTNRPMPTAASRYFFLFGLLLMIVLMTMGADYGGIMVYDYNGGGGACAQPIPFVSGRAPVR